MILSLIRVLSVSILVFVFPQYLLAQFAGGSGTEADPYKVETVEQLQEIRNHTDKHFIQIADIDASLTETWNDGDGFIPIGDDVITFKGVYDGANYSIFNLFIYSDKNRVGLFGEAHGAKLENIKLFNFDITNRRAMRTGGLVGFINSNTIIFNSHVEGVLSSNISSGGLVGQSWGVILNSSADVVLTGTNEAIGGLVGSNLGEIKYSFARGNVSSTRNRIGGLVGVNHGLIENSSAHVTVSGDEEVGGLVGLNNDYMTREAKILNSYSTGTITGNSDVGGFIGLNDGFVKSNYFDLESSEQTQAVGRGSTDGVIGLTTLEMKGKSAEVNMPDLLFEEVWGAIHDNYPKHLWAIPYFQIESLVTNAPITEGQLLSVEAILKNIGGIADTQIVVLKNEVGDTLYSSGNLVIESGQSKTILLQWQSGPGDEGTYTYTVESEYDSQSINFNVRTVPATVELTSPNNQLKDVTVLPLLDWNQAELASHYQLQVSTALDFSAIILDIDNVETLTYEVTDSLDHLTTYYWRARGRADIGDGDWSDVWSFTTIIQSPESVALHSPDNASSNISITPSLQWTVSERAEYYRIQLSESEGFQEFVVDSVGITDLSFMPEELQYNTTYYWRVKALNAGGESEWTESRSFFTEFALLTPDLEGPETDTEVELPVTFFGSQSQTLRLTHWKYRLINLLRHL